MEYIIIVLFLISILFVIGSGIKENGLRWNTLVIVINKIVRLRGLFFCYFFIYYCIKMMIDNDSSDKIMLLPFIICGIAALLSMYKKTRKIGYCLFVITFFGSFFIAIPLMALISGGADSSIFLFVIIGIVMGIYVLIRILKSE